MQPRNLSLNQWDNFGPLLKQAFNVNFDTPIKDLFSFQVVVCRDSKGKIIKTLYQFSPPCDPSYNETQATLLATSLATSLKLGNSILEGDSSIVILFYNNLPMSWIGTLIV